MCQTRTNVPNERRRERLGELKVGGTLKDARRGVDGVLMCPSSRYAVVIAGLTTASWVACSALATPASPANPGHGGARSAPQPPNSGERWAAPQPNVRGPWAGQPNGPMNTPSPMPAPQRQAEDARPRPAPGAPTAGQRNSPDRRRFRRLAPGVFTDDYGLATTLLDAPIGGLSPFGPGLPPPSLRPALAAALPPCPLIIEVGRGLKNTVRTRVIYGHPGCR